MSSRAKVVSKSPAKTQPKKQAPPAKVEKKAEKVTPPANIKGPFAASNYTKGGLSEEEVTQIKAAFDLFDTDQGGSIDTKQLKAAMVSLGFESKNGAIFRMITDLDSDGNGTIDFPQFLGLMTAKITGHDSRAHLGKVFAMFDDEKSGYLSTANLAKVAESLGQTVSQQQLQEMIKRADTDHDGFVNEEQFYNIMTKKV